MLATTLCALSPADLEDLIAGLDAAGGATGAAAITTMSDVGLACVMADLEADARRALTR
jgi:hypothetical protein